MTAVTLISMGKVVRMLVTIGEQEYRKLVPMDVELVAPGVGKITCVECEGRPDEYPSYFPPGAVPHCVHCKGQGWVYVSA